MGFLNLLRLNLTDRNELTHTTRSPSLIMMFCISETHSHVKIVQEWWSEIQMTNAFWKLSSFRETAAPNAPKATRSTTCAAATPKPATHRPEASSLFSWSFRLSFFFSNSCSYQCQHTTLLFDFITVWYGGNAHGQGLACFLIGTDIFRFGHCLSQKSIGKGFVERNLDLVSRFGIFSTRLADDNHDEE